MEWRTDLHRARRVRSIHAAPARGPCQPRAHV